MASPSLSATLTFVKKYPITLCGFSLLFMPSVHRLLLYFTPLLLSTAIFIVAMMTWGPSASSEKSRRKRAGKPKLMAEHQEWDFHASMEIDDDDDDDDDEEEEEEEEEEERNQRNEVDMKVSSIGKASQEIDTKSTKASQVLHTQGTTQKGEVEPDSGLKRRAELEPDPDLGAECGSAGAVASGHEAEPDPDLQEGVGIAAEDAGGCHAESDMFHRCTHADNGRLMGRDVHDKIGHAHDGHDMDHKHALHEMDHTYDLDEMNTHASHAMDHTHDDVEMDHSHANDTQVDHTHDDHCHQHTKLRRANSREHVQDDVRTGADQGSYAIKRLVQVSA